MDFFLFLIYALAAWRLCRLIIEDTITESLRNAIWKKFPPHTFLGYLITCYWCTGIYVASLLTVGYILVPSVMSIIATALALAASVGIINKLVDKD